jgi:hypothetical protein
MPYHKSKENEKKKRKRKRKQRKKKNSRRLAHIISETLLKVIPSIQF